MSFTSSVKNFINEALDRRVPFALYRLPGSDTLTVVTDDSRQTFTISPWLAKSGAQVTVGVRNASCMPMQVPTESTNRAEYLENVSELIANLRRDGGKTVISRVEVGNARPVDWAKAAQDLFDAFPDAFCYLYYTPETGAWMGATPELLLDADSNHNISIMALAGTARADEAWDDKNKIEHRVVLDHILDCLGRFGIKSEAGQTVDLIYGAIKHLHTPVHAKLPQGLNPAGLLDELSPTPAVAGSPRETALEYIRHIERHQRGCYAGYIMVSDDAGLHAYVNLRCVHFDPATRYCIYAGGGITGQSVSESEWTETELKASKLQLIINNSKLVADERR